MAYPSSIAGTSQWSLDPSIAVSTLGVKAFNGRAQVSRTTNVPTLSTGSTSGTISGPGDSSETSKARSASSSSQPGNAGNPRSSGSKSGTTIGIGVGVGITALALLAAPVRFLMRRRRQKKVVVNPSEPAGLEVNGVDTFPDKPEMDAFSAGVVGIRSREMK
jgi:hypothetical protein